MNPFEKAQEVYRREPCARTFDEDLFLHLKHGFVFSTPEYFIMGRAVDRNADPVLIVNPRCTFGRDEANAWMIYLMAGDPSKAWSIMPWPLGWFGFERRNDLRWYQAERIRRLSLSVFDEPIATPV